MTGPTLAPQAATPPAAPAAWPVRLLLDSDDHAVQRAGCQWADPARGRITVDPTPQPPGPR
ncbi:hypothetical protein ABZ746_34150 [Streptomyces sp. NPDC020096]